MILNLKTKLYPKFQGIFKKRILPFLLAFLFFLPVCYLTSLTGLGYTALLSAKENVVPGYSYVLRVALDEAAIGFEGFLSYDVDLLTLDRVVPVNPDLQKEFHVYSENGRISITHHEPVSKILNITFMVSPDAKIGSQIVVAFSSCKVLHADGSQEIPDVSFAFTVVDGRSSDTTLSGFTVSLYAGDEEFDADAKGVNAILQPSFSSKTRVYDAAAPYQYRYYRVKPVATDAKATIQGELQGQLVAGETTEIIVTVLAEDGTKGMYTLRLYREIQPDVSEDPSQDESFTSSVPEDSSEVSLPSSESSAFDENSQASDESEESDFVDGESDVSEFSGGYTPSIPPTPSVPAISMEQFKSQAENWTGIILCIAAVGGVAMVVLLIRILILFRKKQK